MARAPRPVRIVALVKALAALGLVVLLAAVALRWAHTQMAAEVYRDRLRQIVTEHKQLQDHYNKAVRRTAVTELRVAGGRLDVVIRTLDGREKVVATPFDPSGEIYVDFAVRDGRLWIRRVFDATTPPVMGVLIDPDLLAIDWDTPGTRFGKAIYRSLSDGRWIVSVSGDGSLTLAKAVGDAPTPLTPAPAVEEFAEVERSIDRHLDTIGPMQLLRRLLLLPPSGE
jgi:hypothetical protein